MKIVYSLIGSIAAAIACYLVFYNFLDALLLSNPNREPQDAYQNFAYFIYGFYALPFIILLFFIPFLKLYPKTNIRGIAVGGVIGLWFYSLLSLHFSPIKLILVFIPLLSIIGGYLFIKPGNTDIRLRNTLLGMASGWFVGYLLVIGMRSLQNSLTSYFNFGIGEKTAVLVAIASFGIIGWLIAKKQKRLV